MLPATELKMYTLDPVKGNRGPSERYDKLGDLKLDLNYEMDLGLNANSEVRSEAKEILNQLEAENPNPTPTEVPTVLDGNWIPV
ncbi:hypothetical protein QJS04_geneDACA018366 [Acorus gramineus]|uniref:Plastid lipid-associated protein/fibrillin conserved domain-containing protein n=1 Tax=Acorus gramineus TaxID=55184 RepID=A0AAV9A1K6_ACOGR|nr:hypothetical protein QJS04_geneDACA018366 [Acorus gramineus]